MGSCVFSCVKENLKGHKFVTKFSDNCSGQNKNRYIYELIMSLLTIKMQKLKEIQYIFLEKGHTQNANVCMHSTIEQAKRGNQHILPLSVGSSHETWLQV